MYRDFLTNKWVLGGIVFLIVFGVACVVWYHYDTTPYKQDAAEADRIARQWENSKETNANVFTENDTNAPQDSNMSSTEKPKSEATNGVYGEDMTPNKIE